MVSSIGEWLHFEKKWFYLEQFVILRFGIKNAQISYWRRSIICVNIWFNLNFNIFVRFWKENRFSEIQKNAAGGRGIRLVDIVITLKSFTRDRKTDRQKERKITERKIYRKRERKKEEGRRKKLRHKPVDIKLQFGFRH